MSTNRSKSAAGVFVVGGVGNRFLPPDTRAIERAIDKAFGVIAADAGVEINQLMLVASVAEGSDRLLIRSASHQSIRYQCVLPCSPRCFSEDFSSPASIREFEQLLDGADRVLAPESEPEDKLSGYLWASHHILDCADLLLAVWDGEPGNGPAGTADTIDFASGRDVPVLWIPTSSPNEPVRLDRIPCVSS
jgi:hypothetical protein